jgi:hypothetical protein
MSANEKMCSFVQLEGFGSTLVAALCMCSQRDGQGPTFCCLGLGSGGLKRLPHVTWLRALPPREESSGAATCFSAPDLASLSRWTPTLPHRSSLASLRGELRCCHVPHGPQRVVDHRNKERASCPRHAGGLACVQTRLHITKAPARRVDMPLQFGSTVQR